MPDSVKIDSLRTLCEVYSYVTSVREGKTALELDEADIYPNPIYNGGTGHLDFSLPKASNVDIEIYNVIGAYIGKVYKGFLSSGNYQFDVNTLDLTEGVYYLSIRAGNHNVFRKFTAIK